jgi:hypothetical protein
MTLSKEEEGMLRWLGQEEFSQYGECYGSVLYSLLAKGLAQVHGPGEHQVFIAKGTSLMYRAVSLTEAGLNQLKEINNG